MDSISPAFEHTRRQLFHPFRFGQWVRLALVGLLAGELSGGGCNTNFSNFKDLHRVTTLPAGISPAAFAAMITVVLMAAFVLAILFMYIGSVMRFILFDSVLTRECHIREGWGRRQGPAWRYFLWKLGYSLVTLVILVIVVGIPAGFAFAAGWLRNPKAHIAPLVLLGIAVFFVLAFLLVAMAVIAVLTKDFVVPQMALEEIGAIEGWRRLWAMMKEEKGGYAGYIGMKIVLAIAVGILLGIIGFVVGLIIFLPAAAFVIAIVIAAKSAGMGWTVWTITLAIVAACIFIVVFLFLTAMISVPAIVFFPAYSIYFLAPRYPRLSAALYPAPPPHM